MNGVLFGAMMALSMVQQTDTVIAVGNATLLDVQAMGGTIVVDVWDRDEIRVQADHSRRTYLDIDHRGSRISIEPEARRGPANLVEFHLTVPANLDLKLEGMMVDITVNGAMGDVEAETLEGEVSVTGGRGTIKVASMTGAVIVDGAEGLIDVESVAQDIRISNSTGEIVGETMGGSFIMQGVRATSVDIGSVGGDVWYDGTFDPGGTYFFGSHGGSVTLVVPEGTSAQFDLSTIHGSVHDNLSGELQRWEAGERNSLDVGAGEAIVEVETFGGPIKVMRKGTEGEVPTREHGWDEHDGSFSSYMDLGGLGYDLDGLLGGLAGGVSESVAEALSHVRVEVDINNERRRERRPGGGR